MSAGSAINPVTASTRTRIALWLHGVLLALMMGIITWLSSRFDYGSPMDDQPILTMLAFWLLSVLVYLSAIRLALIAGAANWLIPTIVGIAMLLRVILLFSTPILEIDYYRYIWDGHVVAAGVNPYRYTPREVQQAVVTELTSADLRRLVALQQNSHALNTILSRIHFAELPTVYPPVSQSVFALSALTTPSGTAVSTHILMMRVWLMLFDMATLVILLVLLNDCGMPLGWAIVYGWCPLVLKELTNSAHVDAIAVALTLLSICIAHRACYRQADLPSAPSNYWKKFFSVTLAALCLGLSVGAKLYPLVLIPWLLLSIGKRVGIPHAVACAIFLTCVIAACCWPLAISQETLSETEQQVASMPEGSRRIYGELNHGLKEFLTRWEINDLLFLVLIENVKPDEFSAKDPQTGKAILPWFVFTRDSDRVSLCDAIMRSGKTRFPAYAQVSADLVPALFSRAVMLLIFILISVCLASWSLRSQNAETFLRCAFLTLAWFWLLSPTQNPWYWIWALPLVPFAKGRSWLMLSGCVFLYYTRFLFQAPTAELPVWFTQFSHAIYPGEYFFHYVIVWLEFLPFYIWLALESIYSFRNKADATA